MTRALVATLDVGQGYEPGTDLEVGNGVKISFGPGAVSQSTGQACSLDVLADSDTSDILVALGINSFFHGSSAADISVSSDLRANVDALAAGSMSLVSGSGTVIGESAAASAANFDESIGRRIARDNARNKIWALEGYLLRTKLAA